jgi:uncharacterized protein (UPF0254 family)
LFISFLVFQLLKMRGSIKLFRSVDEVYLSGSDFNATFIYSSSYIKVRWINGLRYGIKLYKRC